MNAQGLLAFNTRAGGQVGHGLEGLNEGWSAVGVAAVIEGIHTDENIGGTQHLCQGKGIAQEDGVAGGHIGDRDALAHVSQAAMLGHRHVGGQRRAAECAQVKRQHTMALGPEPAGQGPGSLQFTTLPLAIIKRQGMTGMAL